MKGSKPSYPQTAENGAKARGWLVYSSPTSVFLLKLKMQTNFSTLKSNNQTLIPNYLLLNSGNYSFLPLVKRC